MAAGRPAWISELQEGESMPQTTCVLVVEDEGDMARILEYNLTQSGYSVCCTAEGKAVVPHVRAHGPDLVLLDLRLPDVSGLDVLRDLKSDAATQTVPVIIVSALGDEETVVAGLNLGAADYVTKPFRIRELLARAAAALRRGGSGAPPDGVLSVGAIRLVVDSREVLAEDRAVELTRSEFDILAHCARYPGRVFTRQQLCHHALKAGDAVQGRTIDAHVRTIRRKLGAPGRQLVTVWGIGYKLVAEPAAD